MGAWSVDNCAQVAVRIGLDVESRGPDFAIENDRGCPLGLTQWGRLGRGSVQLLSVVLDVHVASERRIGFGLCDECCTLVAIGFISNSFGVLGLVVLDLRGSDGGFEVGVGWRNGNRCRVARGRRRRLARVRRLPDDPRGVESTDRAVAQLALDDDLAACTAAIAEFAEGHAVGARDEGADAIDEGWHGAAAVA